MAHNDVSVIILPTHFTAYNTTSGLPIYSATSDVPSFVSAGDNISLTAYNGKLYMLVVEAGK